jgi:hypothetical protein
LEVDQPVDCSAALEQLQTDLGAPPTGVVDTATLSAIETRVTQIKAGASTTTPASTTTTP